MVKIIFPLSIQLRVISEFAMISRRYFVRNICFSYND